VEGGRGEAVHGRSRGVAPESPRKWRGWGEGARWGLHLVELGDHLTRLDAAQGSSAARAARALAVLRRYLRKEEGR
jgi:hypothetical protein